jgi:HPt (histidine-containing phosphotransfer) domain-containing protein
MFSIFQNKVIDESLFLEIINNDLSVMNSMINLYHQQYIENIETMRSSIDRNDQLNFERAAHDLKNLGRNIASKKLIAISNLFEDEIEKHRLRDLEKLVNKTEKLLKKAELELKSILKNYQAK